jgi:hypothetical protein
MVEELLSDEDEDNDRQDMDLCAAALAPRQEREREAEGEEEQNKDKEEFRFESFVAKISVGIPVGAYYLNRKVMSTVSAVHSVSLLSSIPKLTELGTGLSGDPLEA